MFRYFHSSFNLYSNAVWTHKSLTGRWFVPEENTVFSNVYLCLFFYIGSSYYPIFKMCVYSVHNFTQLQLQPTIQIYTPDELFRYVTSTSLSSLPHKYKNYELIIKYLRNKMEYYFILLMAENISKFKFKLICIIIVSNYY